MIPIRSTASRLLGGLLSCLLRPAAPWARISRSRRPPRSAAIPPSRSPTTAATPGVVGGDAQSFRRRRRHRRRLVDAVSFQPLNDLIEQALKNNPDLKAAEAALRQAHENALAQRGAFYPSVTAGFSASREQDPPGALAPVPSDNALSVQSVHAAAQHLLYARYVRADPPHGGIAGRAGGSGALSDDRRPTPPWSTMWSPPRSRTPRPQAQIDATTPA